MSESYARQVIHEAVEKAFTGYCFAHEAYIGLVDEAEEAIRSGIPAQVKGGTEHILAVVLNAGWQIALDDQRVPLSFFGEPKEPEERLLVEEAVDNLILKGIEVSFAKAQWGPSPGQEEREAGDSTSRKGVFAKEAILSKDEIIARLGARWKQKRLHIVPLLDPDQVSKAGVDLRLGTHFVVTRPGDITYLAPMGTEKEQKNIHELLEEVPRALGYKFVLHPGRIVLGSTFEYLALPDDLAALVLSRSSYGRLGLLVATATFVNPGWRGCLTLELANYSEVPIELRCGEPVAQLVLLHASRLSEVPRYSRRTGLCPIKPLLPDFLSKDCERQNLLGFEKWLE